MLTKVFYAHWKFASKRDMWKGSPEFTAILSTSMLSFAILMGWHFGAIIGWDYYRSLFDGSKIESILTVGGVGVGLIFLWFMVYLRFKSLNGNIGFNIDWKKWFELSVVIALLLMMGCIFIIPLIGGKL